MRHYYVKQLGQNSFNITQHFYIIEMHKFNPNKKEI